MSGILFRYVARAYFVAFLGILAVLVAIFLVADFADHAVLYTGPGWMMDVAILYAHKTVVAIRQLGPGALLLAAGTTVSLLRRRGELTALFSVGVGPSALYVPVAVSALIACTGLVALDEWLVIDAARRIDEIHVTRFGSWGDWRFYFTPQKWFRRGDRIFYLRGGSPEAGFSNVTVLELTPDFRVAKRLDAQRLEYLEGTRWRMDGLVERRFAEQGQTAVETLPSAEVDLETNDRPFRITKGRPEQMRLFELRQQIKARREGGLTFSEFSLALHNRFAYPLAGLPAALLAIGLALRPGRRGHVTAALMEGVAIAMVLWGMMVILRTLALAQHLSAGLAAWAPALLLAAVAGGLWAIHEGRIHFGWGQGA